MSDVVGPPGKRTSTDEPLTPHDVAQRLDRAALRVLRIMMEVRQTPGLQEAVLASRYHTNVMDELAAELQRWGIEPFRVRDGVVYLPPDRVECPTCGAWAGQPCHNGGVIMRNGWHPAREHVER